MSVLAIIRPDSWDVPLLLHILGAMVLVGGLVATAGALSFAGGDAKFLRIGYRSLLAVALPGWVLMRGGAEWIYTKEGWDDLPAGVDDPTWLGLGFVIGDTGGLILFAALIVGGIGTRRLNDGRGSGLLRATLILSVILLVAYLIAIWAMAGKPD
jgi:hypothetical protein